MRVLLSWSAGKDSAWALHVLWQRQIEVVCLLSTIDEATEEVSMQGVPRRLLQRQADAVGLDVWPVTLPSPCPNDEYERRMGEVTARAEAEGMTHVAFGDLYLEDIRAYREEMMAPTPLEPLFPIWCGAGGTAALAQDMREAGVTAIVTCVDPARLDPSHAGTDWDPSRLPAEVDPLGERGEFHTFCTDGPAFSRPVPVSVGGRRERNGFWWAELGDPQ
ncbi:MAG: ATP-binding protein [Actinomycetota bacterium]